MHSPPGLIDNVVEMVWTAGSTGTIGVLYSQTRLFAASKEVLVGVFLAVAATAVVLALEITDSPHSAGWRL